MKLKVDLKSIEEAPNFEELNKKFGVDKKYTIISYGDSIYAPDSLSGDLLQHELTHCERQKFNKVSAKRWWDRYMIDEVFRLEEEAIAYQQQFNYCKKVFKDRNKLAKIKFALASELSSAMYGNIIGQQEAMKLIK